MCIYIQTRELLLKHFCDSYTEGSFEGASGYPFICITVNTVRLH